MMAQEWRQTTIVHGGGHINVVVPDLRDGELVDVVIRRNGAEVPAEANGPTFGSARGRVFIRDDFDQPLEDFADYM